MPASKRSSRRTSAAETPAKTRTTTRTYVVVQQNGDTLTVVDPAREAKHAIAASDAMVAELPPEKRTGRYGAFLLSSYRSKEYTAEQTWVTNGKEIQKPLFTPPAQVADDAPPADDA